MLPCFKLFEIISMIDFKLINVCFLVITKKMFIAAPLSMSAMQAAFLPALLCVVILRNDALTIGLYENHCWEYVPSFGL